MGNEKLHKASKANNDEFYTKFDCINDELRHYKHHFKGKVVFCNCDDPYESNFFKYFAMNFNHLELKKLITTGFAGSPIAGTNLFLEDIKSIPSGVDIKKCSYKVEITEINDENMDGAIDLADVEYLLKNNKNSLTIMKGNGDFRSEESIELLKQADIVASNPPFSLFIDYILLLKKYNKDFVIVGNKNAITYKDVFNLIKDNMFFVGHRRMTGGMWLSVPDGHEFDKEVDGVRLKNVPACWFTNLDIQKHHEDLILYKSYYGNEHLYPKYENFDAINVDKVSEIPVDYDGEIGVPITFMDKYNPEQFEIITLGIVGSCEFTKNTKMEILDKKGDPTGKYTYNAKGTLYKKYNPETDKSPAFRDVTNNELYSSIYARIIIRKRR
jgi:hypothetical protein